MQGWLKLHRKLIENPLFQDPNMFKLWVLCLMKAAHRPTSFLIDRQMVELQAGQFVTGRKALCEEYNRGAKPAQVVKETTLWSWLKRLEEWGNLDIKSHNKYSLVTVVKWEFYQGSETDSDSIFDNKMTTDCQQIDSSLTADCQQTDTNKNVKNLENVKNSLIPPTPPTGVSVETLLRRFGEEFKTAGVSFSSFDREEIDTWLNDGRYRYSPDLIMRGLKEAVLHKKVSVPYIDSILRDWKEKGWLTPEQVERGKQVDGGHRTNQPTSGPKIVEMPARRRSQEADDRLSAAEARRQGGGSA